MNRKMFGRQKTREHGITDASPSGPGEDADERNEAAERMDMEVDEPRREARNSRKNRAGRPDSEAIRPSEAKESMLKYLEDRFGMQRGLFDNHSLYLGPKGRIYLGPSNIPPSLKIVSPGLLVSRVENGVKPSTNLFQLFGRHVTKNVLNLGPQMAARFVKGEDLLVSNNERGECSDGFVLVRHGDYDLGCALLRGGTLKNQVPKAKRLILRSS